MLLLTGLLGMAFGVFLRVLAALLIALPCGRGPTWLHRRAGLPDVAGAGAGSCCSCWGC
ncbi:MAG: hypothetical protein WKG07_04430 [Hymenobacter sp.]